MMKILGNLTAYCCVQIVVRLGGSFSIWLLGWEDGSVFGVEDLKQKNVLISSLLLFSFF